MTAADDEPGYRFGSLAVPILLPTLVFAIGEGAIIPVIPIVASALGADLATAALVTAMLLLGQLVGDVPSGWLVARIGERAAMIGAALLSIAGAALAALAGTLVLLGLGIFVIGLSAAVFALARHSFMTSYVPYRFRARALATLAGTFRLGMLSGPFLAAAVIAITGGQAVFWVHALGCLIAALLLLLLRDPERIFTARTPAEQPIGLLRTLHRKRGVLVRLGTGAAIVSALRASRQVVLPLWAVSIGVPDAMTAVIIGIGAALDFALFYASGQVMDRWGRLAAALPAMLGLGLGHITLSLTHDVPGADAWFIVLTIALGIANGIGSGILMTLGADLADRADPAAFLSAWRFTVDLGGAASPMLITALTAALSLPIAVGTMGALGLIGAGILLRYVPRYTSRE